MKRSKRKITAEKLLKCFYRKRFRAFSLLTSRTVSIFFDDPNVKLRQKLLADVRALRTVVDIPDPAKKKIENPFSKYAEGIMASHRIQVMPLYGLNALKKLPIRITAYEA